MSTPSFTARQLVATVLIVTVVLGTLPAGALAQSESGASGSVVVEEGETVDEVNALSGSVVVDGTVTGDVNALSGSVTITGDVGGDVNTAAGTLEIGEGAEVGGDVSVGAGEVVVADGATVTGDFQTGAGTVQLDGSVDGDAAIGAETITLGEEAAIAGDLRYDGSLEGNTAAVAGDVTRDSTLGIDIAPTIQPIASWLFSVYALALNLLLGAALLALFPRFSDGVAARVSSDPVRTGLVGVLLLVGIPVLLIALAITVVGIPFALAGGFAFAMLAWVAVVYGRFAVAAWVLSLLEVENRWLALVAGMIGGAVLAQVPYVGGLANLLIFLLGLGALSIGLYTHGRRARESPAPVRSDESPAG